MYLVKNVKAGRFRVKAFEDDAYCYIEVENEVGALVENLSVADCDGNEFDKIVKKYIEASNENG